METDLKPFAVREQAACQLTGLKRSTLLALAYRGAIPSYLVGRCRLYRVADLERWVEEQAHSGETITA